MNPNKVALLVLFVTVCSCAKIPSTLKRCYRKDKDFPECLRAAVEDSLKLAKAPIKEIGLLSLEPVNIPSMVIAPGDGPVNLEQKYKNMKIVGLSQAKVNKADMNFVSNTLTLQGFTSLARADFEYEASGRILVLPIEGNGPGFVEMHKLDFTFTAKLEEYEKTGGTHYKVVDSKFVLSPQLLKINLDNLFNGDKALGDNVNKVLNENWQELWADVKPSYEEAFAKIFADICNRVFTKLSKKELFGDP